MKWFKNYMKCQRATQKPKVLKALRKVDKGQGSHAEKQQKMRSILAKAIKGE